LKAVCEIVGILLNKVGLGVMENLNRELILAELKVVKYRTIRSIRKADPAAAAQPQEYVFRFGRKKAVCALCTYVWLHAMLLTFEMFIIHVVLTIQTDSWFTYVFLNCLGEIKISVFKKVDSSATFQVLCDDSVDRLNLMLFILAAVI
jgi:hypothetical protein